MPESFLIRAATLTDVATVAHHRAAMFEDMGSTTPDVVAPLVAETEQFLRDAIPRGEYRGWLAVPAHEPERVVGGVGIQLRRVSPFPRRRGLARRLMTELLTWARSAALDSLILHAAPAGRALYEELGFAPTNEMRLMGEL